MTQRIEASGRFAAMRVFLDFEASSLSDDSYPIEVGWVFEDGRAEEWLIRPEPGWTDWDPEAEALHGLSRQKLEREGAPAPRVAGRVLEVLSGHDLYVTAPSWDGKWLSVLLRAGGLPRHALRAHDSDVAHIEAAHGLVGGGEYAASMILAEARDNLAGEPPKHRALADAQAERAVWLEVQRLARERAGAGA